jgi:fatty acid desaturase
MEQKTVLIETLLEKTTDYGKVSYELAKLKTLDKTSDMSSSLIIHSIIFAFVLSCLLFFSLGLAYWLGEILGKIYFGFFVVSAFYAITVIILHFFMHKYLKRIICNYIIKQMFKQK